MASRWWLTKVYPINTVSVQGIVVEETWVLADWFLPRPGTMGPCHYGHWLPTYGVSVRSWVPTSLDWINLEISRYTYTFHVRDILLQERFRQKPPHTSASRCCPMLPTAVSSLMVVAYILSFDVLDVLREVQRMMHFGTAIAINTYNVKLMKQSLEAKCSAFVSPNHWG